MDMTCTVSAESLGCSNNLKLKVSYVALKSSYPWYRWTSSSWWNVKVTWMMSSTSSTAVDYQTLTPAVLILLTSKVSYLSFKLPFIPSNDWSCYSVLYFHFCSLIVTWLSFFLSLEITTESVVIMSCSWEWSLGESGLQNKSEISIQLIHIWTVTNILVLENVTPRLILTSVTVFHLLWWPCTMMHQISIFLIIQISSSLMPTFLPTPFCISLPLHKFKTFLTFLISYMCSKELVTVRTRGNIIVNSKNRSIYWLVKENHKMSEVGRVSWRPFSPISLTKQGPLEHGSFNDKIS